MQCVFFLNYLAGLYDEADAGKIKEGTKLLMNKVMHLTQNINASDAATASQDGPNVLMIQAP
jgi:hypothetical protein